MALLRANIEAPTYEALAEKVVKELVIRHQITTQSDSPSWLSHPSTREVIGPIPRSVSEFERFLVACLNTVAPEALDETRTILANLVKMEIQSCLIHVLGA